MPEVKIANLCMISNRKTNEVLMIDRVKSWKGLAFPGGQIEKRESISKSIIREVLEETGLKIEQPIFCGIKHWQNKKSGDRYLVFCFKTSEYIGDVKSSSPEGKLYWKPINELPHLNLAKGLKEELPLFLEDKYFEIFAEWDDDKVDSFIWL